MADSQAVRSHPFSVYIELTTGVFTRIPEVIGDITTPEADRKEIDVTSHDSDAEQFLLGLKTYGECSFDMNLIPSDATQEAIIDAGEANDTTYSFKVADSDTAPTLELTFDARVKPVSFSFPDDEQVRATVNLRSTGDVTLTELGS
jgi:predicted secreted protein